MSLDVLGIDVHAEPRAHGDFESSVDANKGFRIALHGNDGSIDFASMEHFELVPFGGGQTVTICSI
ncbi:MAG: hypothetical protein CMI17_07745 [Opitutaceae bacterium]|nr:hypothetical protein [Opitutaceae bacterium]